MGAYAEEAVAQARTMLDPVTLAHSLNRVANWHVQIEQPLESLRYHQQALPLFEETGHRRGMAETLDFLGIANYFSGDLWQGTHCYTRAIALFRELDERPLLTSCLTNLLWGTPTYLTDTMVPSTMPFDEITRAAQEACTLSREIGRRSSESFAQLMLAIALGTRGEYRKALTLARSSLEIATEIEHRQWTAASHCALGVIFHDLLAPDRAQWHLEQFHDIATTMHSVHEMRCAAAFLASVHVTQRAFGQAAALLDANLDANTQTHTLVQRLLWTARAECVLAQGDARTALGIVDRLLASATNLASQQTIPRVAMVRGRALVALKQFDDAEIVLSAAQRTARDHEALPLLWRILGDQGRLYLATGRRVQAADAFAAARSIVGRLADQLDDDTLRAQFLDRTVTRIPRGRPLSALRAARQGYGGLTAREREVAVLVAQGHANRVIAELLVVSERTVEVHVSNALSKLGFASRVQIAAWVVEHGLLKNYVASPQKS